jgi:hypothetical protein
LVSSISVERGSDFSTGGDFFASTINEDLDKQTLFSQQLEEQFNRTLAVPVTEPVANELTLPENATRKGKVLAFNSSTGLPEMGPTIADTTSVANATTNIGSVAGSISNVNTVAGLSSSISTLVGLSSEISTLAAKATELGRLGTADAVSDMNTLAVSDVVSDMNTLATSDIVSDLNTLATSDIVSDLNTLATSDAISDMNTLATSSNVTNMNTLAGISSNITSVAGIASNVTAVANNEANVNRYASEYTISSSAPGSPSEGDLWYDSTNNILKYYSGSEFIGIVGDTDKLVSVSANDSTPGVLNGKLTAGANISLTEGSDGGNETLAVALNSAKLTAIDGLAVTDGNFVVGNGSTFVAESGATARASLGLDRPNVKPLFYNGDYSLYQRTTSATGIATYTYHAPDRWRGGTDDGNDAGRLTIARDSDVPVGEGVKYSLKYSCTTVGTLTTDGWTELTQVLEGNDLQAIRKGTSNAQPLTLSVYVKSNLSGASNLITAILYDNDNARHVSQTAQISSGGTWQQLIFNFPADTTGAFDMDNAASLYVQLLLGQGTAYTSGTLGTTWQANDAADYASPNNMNLLSSTSNYINFAKAQLEIGQFTASTLPPFQHESYQENLTRCQRYLYISENFGQSVSWSEADINDWHSYVSGANYGDAANFQYPVTMRATPTKTTTSIAGTSGKISEILDQGGAVISDVNAHAVVGGKQVCQILEYAEQSYGIIANIKADAEL